ncbi:hypothetical protein GCM10028805_42120 [Spirosoma harenae]
MNTLLPESLQGHMDTLANGVKPMKVFSYTYHPYFMLTDLGRLVSLGIAFWYLHDSSSFPFYTFLGVFGAVFVIYKVVRDRVKVWFGTASRSFLQDTVLIILPTYYAIIRWVVRADLAEAFDLVALIVPFYLFFSRLGCFVSGCCYGLPSPFGVWYSADHFRDVHGCRHFKAAHPPRDRVLPTQLIEAIFSLFIGFCLLYLHIEQKLVPGTALCVYFLFYCPLRFGIDFFRVSSARPRYGRFSEAQLFCVAIFILASFIVW